MIARSSILKTGIDLKISLPDLELKLWCRPAQMIQILLNLLANSTAAISSLSEKWIRIDIKVVSQSDGEYALISVTDSGPGLRKDIAARVFEPYFSTKNQGSNLGLGLGISRLIVHDHGGEIWLDRDQPNTCFRMTLPLGEKEIQ